MNAIDICKKNIPKSKAKNQSTIEQIKRDHPDIIAFAKSITEEFGPYVGCRIYEDGEQIFEWKKK